MGLLDSARRGQQQVEQMEAAWENLSQVAPEITQALEGATETIAITYSTTLADSFNGITLNNVITINDDLLGDNTDLTSTLGHESFHQIADLNGFTVDSYLEEAYCSSIHEAVDVALGRWFFNDFWNPNDVNPGWDEASVIDYITNYDWGRNTQLACWDSRDGIYRITPRDDEGGYSAMHDLYVQYYPD